jgi:isopentenyl diphosphate isomerase/L-lactate dehydrogenase-like FMN-dependent dehydrogenase
MLDPDGELAMARAAAAAGTVMCLSTLATATPTEVAAAAPGGRRWFQLYPFSDAAVTRALMAEAVAAGFEAVVLTVDAPPGGRREQDVRTGFTIPAEVEIPSVAAALGPGAFDVQKTFDLLTWSLTWDDLGGIAAAAGVPLIVKGLLTAEDAALAVEHGAAGVVVSNHGGRQLDRAVASAEALPEVVEAVAGRAMVLVDGGIRRGTDVAIAMALGADAVLVGRPTAWGLAAAGAAGAEWVLRTLAAELELTLALCGLATPGELGPEHLRRPGTTRVYSDVEVSSNHSF